MNIVETYRSAFKGIGAILTCLSLFAVSIMPLAAILVTSAHFYPWGLVSLLLVPLGIRFYFWFLIEGPAAAPLDRILS